MSANGSSSLPALRLTLRIVHCFRSPVGGIFRHVRDLVDAQHAAGHQLAILCDSTTGGEYEERLFADIRPKLALGLIRIPMNRAVTPSDFIALMRSAQAIYRWRPDIVHSHGAKGGAYARIIATAIGLFGPRPLRLYSPHGGSVHYDPALFSSRLYFLFERVLERMTDRLIFVSQYEADGYRQKIGTPHCQTSVIYNGLREAEFEPVAANADAADFAYIGMMRDLKGPDVFLRALAILRDRHNRQCSAHFIGDGPDKPRYLEMIKDLGLEGQVAVHDSMPARQAFAMTNVVVVPSRAELMPYLVLEAAAAGKPLVATRVGGIPEIFADEAGVLVEPDNAEALAEAMLSVFDDGEARAARLRQSVKARFSLEQMVAEIQAIYEAPR